MGPLVRRATIASLCFGVPTALAAPARAELWGEGRAGVGLASGRYEFEKGYVDSTTGPLVAHDESGPLGVAVVLEGMGGYAVSPTVALGVVGRVELAPYLESIRPRHASLDLLLLAGAGPMLAVRPGKHLDLRLGLEWVAARFAGSRLEIGADDNVFEFEPLSGPGAFFALGCCAERGLGIATELHGAWLSSDHQKFVPVTFTLLATLATR